MSDPAPRPPWRPPARWHVQRIVGTLGPALAFGYVLVTFTDTFDPPKWLFIVGLATVPFAIADIRRGRRARRARREGLQGLGAEPGWGYFPSDPRFTGRWSTRPFGQGRHRRAYDVAIGVHNGMSCAAFTYQYTEGSGDNQCTTVMGVTTLLLPGRLPPITVTPESLAGDIAPGIVGVGVDVESDTFNRRYRVRTPYPKYASDVLTPRTVEALLSVEPFSWCIDGCDIVAWGPATDDVASVLARLDMLATIANNIPQFVWKDVARPV